MKLRHLILTAAVLVATSISAQTTYLTTADFKTKVVDYTTSQEWNYQGKLPCLIDFYTTWCGPCKRLAPILEELAAEYKGKIVIYKVDTEKDPELAGLFGIRSIPTMLLCPMKGNPYMEQGLRSKEEIKGWIDQILLGK